MHCCNGYVHSIIITTSTGNILLRQYNTKVVDTDNKINEWETQLSQNLNFTSLSIDEGYRGFTMIEDKYVVYIVHNGLLVFISGTDEYEELTYDCCAKNVANEAHMMDHNAYGKIAVGLQDMICNGSWELANLDTILKVGKLKEIPKI